jgi:putative ABC transport system permease protein
MRKSPPKLAHKLLLSFLRNDLAEEVLGDLEEKFQTTLKNSSLFAAQLNYWHQVLNYVRPFAFRKSGSNYLNHYIMFQSYFKIGWRNLLKNKGYSLINIGGLAVGMAVAILNGLWLWDELSFNTYHKNYDHIAQFAKGSTRDGEYGVGLTMTYPLGTELKTNYNHYFKRIVRASFPGDCIISWGEQKISAIGQSADAEIAEMLTLKMVSGNRAGLKHDSHSVILSAKIAKAIFGDADPLGKVISLNNTADLTVAGIYEDLPQNTAFYNIDFFTNWDFYLLTNPWIEKRAVDDWRNHFIRIYAEILPGADFGTVSEQIRDAELKNLAGFKEEASRKPQIFLFPMNQWHLYPYDRGQVNNEPVQMVWLVGIIGLFVLILACINFMNLSTARSEKRAKEVGIRKSIGSVRSQLVTQFFSESYLVVFFAFGMAVLLANLLLPFFNGLMGKDMVMLWFNKWFWLLSLCFVFITGLLAGSYPALYLSSFNPVKVLKGTFRVGRFASVPRRVLVVVQFTISVVLIISTVVVYQQIQFAKNRPVGYDRSGLITMQMKSGDFYGKYDLLRNELKNTGAVEEMSQSMGPVTDVYSGNSGFIWKGKELSDDSFGTLAVTHEHGKTVGWQFVAGRDFSREYASDSAGMVINESAARFFESQNPVGEEVIWRWWQGNRAPLHYRILGVVKDMVMESPYAPIEPTVFYIRGHNGSVSWINIKLNPEMNVREALGKVQSVFNKIIPTAPFEYKFVDEEYNLKFAAEERIGRLASFFGVLAVMISCLGLFGLASFVAEQRTKEIGIRKVLGATVKNLWAMLSKDFVLLVIISCALAIPIADYYLGSWLQQYEYRVDISGWVFALTALGTLIITLLTVSFQAVKAALMNPVKSLRSE